MTVAVHLTALTVAVIYYGWRDGYLARLRRDRTIRQRVAYLLWSAAQQVA